MSAFKPSCTMDQLHEFGQVPYFTEPQGMIRHDFQGSYEYDVFEFQIGYIDSENYSVAQK